jgi:hypothetical protein
MKLAVLIIFSLCGIVFEQTNSDTHIIPENDPVKIVERISYNLEMLEREYLTKLSYRDYVKAKNILIETYNLVLAIPLPPAPTPVGEGPYPMSDTEYNQFIESLKQESFEENQISVVEISSQYNFFSVSQVVGVINEFTYSSGKLKALELLYTNVIDPENSHLIIKAFTYSSDKEKAKEIINRN